MGIELLKTLKVTKVRQLWVTTRPHLEIELHDKLKVQSFLWKPFSKDEQVEILKSFWKKTANSDQQPLTDMAKKAEDLIDHQANSVKDLNEKFTDNPLHIFMLTRVYSSD